MNAAQPLGARNIGHVADDVLAVHEPHRPRSMEIETLLGSFDTARQIDCDFRLAHRFGVRLRGIQPRSTPNARSDAAPVPKDEEALDQMPPSESQVEPVVRREQARR